MLPKGGEKRTHEQTEKEGLRNKKAKFSFQIKGNNGNEWYNTDGIKYDEDYVKKQESTKEIELRNMIKDLEKKLLMAKKVLYCTLTHVFIINKIYLTSIY